MCSTSGDGGSDANGTLHPDNASVLLSGATMMTPYCSAICCGFAPRIRSARPAYSTVECLRSMHSDVVMPASDTASG